MTRLAKIYFITLTGLPLTASASGQDVLNTVFIQVIFFILFLVAVSSFKIRLGKKALLLGIYLVAVIATSSFTWDLPYDQNVVLINALNVTVPAVPVVACIIGMKLRKK